MKIKHEPKKRKSIDERITKKNYSGEASPYWDHMAGRQRQTDEGNPTEDILANPDVLSEEDTLHGRPLTEIGGFQLQIIRELMPTFPLRERQAIELCGLEGHTEEMAATILGIKRRTLRTSLNRARLKILRVFEARLQAENK